MPSPRAPPFRTRKNRQPSCDHRGAIVPVLLLCAVETYRERQFNKWLKQTQTQAQTYASDVTSVALASVPYIRQVSPGDYSVWGLYTLSSAGRDPTNTTIVCWRERVSLGECIHLSPAGFINSSV